MALQDDNPAGHESSLGIAGLTALLRPPIEDPALEIEPGTQLGDITIVRQVGVGGMGRVYEGRQGMPSRIVAVKVIHPGLLTPAAMRRFEHEAHILGRLTHPGIARIYAAGTQLMAGRPVPYFVMEYIDKALPITAYATAHRLSTSDRVRLFSEACAAIAYGHRMGIIHRDVKPANMLVDAGGRAKIIDFGVARCTEHDAPGATVHTTAGHLVGTLRYMSPEQFDGDAETLDVRADVYALGLVLYELLTGRLPYDIARCAVYEAARIVKQVDPEPLSRTSRRFRGDLETIVAKCLEKDRGRRYSSADELEADLARHLRGEPITARPPSLLDGVNRLARRHPVAAAATAGMAVALAFGIVGMTAFAMRADAARREAVRFADEAARERARANAEAATARQRLYVANLQALQSCLEKKNPRQARLLAAENAALVGPDLPLEMRCLSADLDDALTLVELGKRPVTRLEYSPEAHVLAASVVQLPSFKGTKPFMVSPEAIRIELGKSRFTETAFLAINEHHAEPVAEGDAGWAPAWATLDRAAGAAAVRIRPLAVSLDRRWQAVPAPEGRVRVVDAATGREQSVLETGRGQFGKVAFLADRGRLAILMNNGCLTLWDADSGRPVAVWGQDGPGVEDFYASADGTRLAVVLKRPDTAHDALAVHETTAGKRLASVPTRQGLSPDNRFVVFSPDSRSLITSCYEADLHVWDTDDGTPLARLQGHSSTVREVAFAADGGHVASSESNGRIHLWNTRTWSLEREFVGHPGRVLALAFSPDGTTLASGSEDGSIRIWPRTGARWLAELPGVRGASAVSYSPDGDQLAVAPTGVGSLELWNPITVQRLRTLHGPGGVVSHVAYAADGATVAAAFEPAGQPGSVCVWRSATGDLLATFAGHENGVTTVAFSPDGKRLLTTSGSGSVTTWDLGTGSRLLEVFPGPTNSQITTAAVFGLGGGRIATRAGRMVDVTTGQVALLKTRLGQVSGVAASPDGRILAIGGVMGSLKLVDFATGGELASLAGHQMAARVITFSPDGKRLATGSLDGTAKLWDVRSGVEVHVLRGHDGPVNAVRFTPDGGRVVTASKDGTVRIWDASLGQQLLVLPCQQDIPEAIAIAPDGRQMVTALPDGTVRIWGLSNAMITRARAAAAVPRPPAALRARAETPRGRQDPDG